MEYINVKTAANIWGISERRVRYYCAENRIPGAEYVGRQWIIPVNATRPVDNRTVVSKFCDMERKYHFPVLTHTVMCSQKDSLLADEKELYYAFEEYFRCNYSGSYNKAEYILKTCDCDFIKAGAYYLMAISALVLGSYSKFKRHLNSLEALANEISSNQEDYKLLVATVRFDITWSINILRKINIEKLSAEALSFYNTTLATAMCINAVNEDKNTLLQLEIQCLSYENTGQYSNSIIQHMNAASLSHSIEDDEKAKYHIRKAYVSAKRYGYFIYLSKYSVAMDKLICDVVKEDNPDLAEKILIDGKRCSKNVRYIAELENGRGFLEEDVFNEPLLMSLLSFDISDENIAKFLGEDFGKVQKKIVDLCLHFRFSSRSQLVEYAQSLYK